MRAGDLLVNLEGMENERTENRSALQALAPGRRTPGLPDVPCAGKDGEGLADRLRGFNPRSHIGSDRNHAQIILLFSVTTVQL